jgi:hypothetical protein
MRALPALARTAAVVVAASCASTREGLRSAPPDPALAAADAFIAQERIDRSRHGWKTDLPVPPELPFDEGSDYFTLLETSKGPIRLRLFTVIAPYHAASFLFLARVGFYDDLTPAYS